MMSLPIQLSDEMRERGERNYFTHYIFYEHPKRNYKEGVCSCCGNRVYVRHCPDGYPDGIEFYGDSDLWYARHGTKGECPNCGVKVTYKAAGIAKGCYNLEETSNLVIFLPEKGGQKVYADCYTVLAQPHTSGRTVFSWYPKAKYVFELGKCYAEIYPYMLYNYFGRYGELMATCGWREIGSIQRSGDRPYEPWQGYMYNPAGYWLVNLEALDNTFLQYAKLDQFLGIGTRNQATHLYAMKYLWWYCHYPSLEIAMRTGVYDPVQNVVYDGTKSHKHVDINARRPWDFFRLPKLDFKLWVNVKKDRYGLLQLMHKRKITGQKQVERLIELHAFCEYSSSDTQCVLEYADKLSFPIKEWLKYMRKQPKKKDIAGYWLDYMGMAEKANILATVNAFPKSLIQAHDALASQLNKLYLKKKVEDQHAFIERLRKRYPGVKKVCDRIRDKFEYRTDEYSILVPGSIKDIIAEGIYLNHFLADQERYFDRIVTKESFILFLRRTEYVDDPWYTLEIEPDGTIRQKRTYGHDQLPDLDAARPFLKEWQAVVAKRLEQADLALAAVSRQKRIEGYAELRRNKKRIRGGALLADVLEKDLQINLEVQVG